MKKVIDLKINQLMLYVNRKDMDRQLKVGMKESEIINVLFGFMNKKVLDLLILAKLLM